ncbi:MAG: mucoidy inhibitor MuiA family protein [Alphaproteobacteria bacterium]|nr:mucoidy inhibitor MuiA family protein [Alphaproteobacteria bacterium]
MRRMLLVLALSVLPFPAFAEDIAAKGDVTAVTVFADRAALTRHAKVEVPKGAHTLTFKGLPISLLPDSLNAKGKALATVTFGAVTWKMEAHEDYVVPKEKELNATLIELQDKRRVYGVEKQALDAGRLFLANLGKTAEMRENEDIAQIDLKPEEWGAASDAIANKVADNLKSGIALDILIRGVDEDIRKTQEELSNLRTGQKQTYTVTIPLEAAAATTLDVDLVYQVPGAGWTPVYDARLDTKTGKMDLVQYGSVWQRTGEDWDDVALTLSTAQPSRGAGLPPLPPQWVNLQQAYKARGQSFNNMASNIAGGPAMMVAMDAAMPASAPMEADKEDRLERWKTLQEERALVEAGFDAAQINSEGFVGEYAIPGPAKVASDGTKSRLMIGAFDSENKMQVQIKPQLAQDAYLVVKTKLKGENPVLPGQVNLFRDGAFIGQGNIPMLRPGDEEDLAFGIDDNVRVKRNVLKDERSESGLISKEASLERNLVRYIQNLHKDPIEIVVLETIPVSKDEKIRVELLKDKTTQGYAENVDNIKGLLRWTMTMKPQEKTEINLGWKVSWPKDQIINGL